MEGLTSFAKVCKCQPWVQHVQLVGKANTEAAGAYPQELTDALAVKIVETRRRVLNLEWLRFQLSQKSNRINELQVKWLDNEEKRTKRIYEEGAQGAHPLIVGWPFEKAGERGGKQLRYRRHEKP